MKHLLLAISLFLFLVPKQGVAQIQSGTSIIGVVARSKFSQGNSSAALSGNYSKFINPHFAVGGGVAGNITAFTGATLFGLNLSANGMYVLNPSPKAPFYVGVGGYIGTFTGFNINNQPFRSSFANGTLSIGNFFFINQNIALNSGLSLNRSYWQSNTGFDANTRLNFELSLTPFLQGGLREEIALEEGESLFAANRITVKGNIGYYDIATKLPDSVSHIRKNLEASFFLMKGLEIGTGLTDNYISPFAAFYLPMQHRVGILAEVQYQKVINKKSLENSTWIPSLGAAYF